jgi:hypothetical protein
MEFVYPPTSTSTPASTAPLLSLSLSLRLTQFVAQRCAGDHVADIAGPLELAQLVVCCHALLPWPGPTPAGLGSTIGGLDPAAPGLFSINIVLCPLHDFPATTSRKAYWRTCLA